MVGGSGLETSKAVWPTKVSDHPLGLSTWKKKKKANRGQHYYPTRWVHFDFPKEVWNLNLEPREYSQWTWHHSNWTLSESLDIARLSHRPGYSGVRTNKIFKYLIIADWSMPIRCVGWWLGSNNVSSRFSATFLASADDDDYYYSCHLTLAEDYSMAP